LYAVFKSISKQSKDYLIVTNRLPIYRSISTNYDSIFLAKNISIANDAEIRKLKQKCKLVLNDFQQNENIKLPIGFIFSCIDKELDKVVSLYFQFKKLIEKHKPKSVFIGNDTTVEGRIMTFLLKKYSGIKSFCIMHGSVTGEPLDTYHQVDCFFLYGRAALEDLVRNGMQANRLKVSGAPYMDDFLFSNTKRIDNELKNILELSDSKPYILITNSGPGHSTSIEHYERTLNAIFEVASQFEHVQWVIKLHRKDSLNNFQKVLAKYPNHTIKIISSHDTNYPESIFTWLQGASCILTGASTVAIEAMALDIPVVTMDFMNEFKKVDFIESLATIHVTSLTELQFAITNLLTNKVVYEDIFENSKKYAHNYFYKGDIKSSELIANELLS
jgi:hypothetical protein